MSSGEVECLPDVSGVRFDGVGDDVVHSAPFGGGDTQIGTLPGRRQSVLSCRALCPWYTSIVCGSRGRDRTFNLLVQSQAFCRLNYPGTSIVGCGRRDSNPHSPKGTGPSSRRVYQFHHVRVVPHGRECR